MSLRMRILVSVMMTGIIVSAIIYAVSTSVVMESFQELENRNTRNNVSLALAAINENLDNLESICGDWAGWNDSRDFVQGKYDGYREETLTTVTLVNLRLDFILYYDLSNHLFEAKGVDLAKSVDAEVSPNLIQYLANHENLFEFDHPTAYKTGIIQLSEKIVLVSICPITDSNFALPINGALIFGRYLSEHEINRLSENIMLPIQFVPLDRPELPDDFQAALAEKPWKESIAIQLINDDLITGYTELADINGQPRFMMRVDTTREVHQQGRDTVAHFLSINLLVLVVITLAFLYMLNRTVTRPVSILINSIAEVAKTGDHTMRLPSGGKDELGKLARAANLMLKSLGEASARQHRTDLQLFQAQKQESLNIMAGSIAHNFNNILQVVQGGTELALMDVPADSKARKLLEKSQVATGRAIKLSQLMLTCVGYKKDTIASLDLSEVTHQLVDLISTSASDNIRLKTNLAENLPDFIGDQVQIQQLIMNLVTNSMEALAEKNGTIEITTGVVDCNEPFLKEGLFYAEQKPGTYLFLGVRDNGCGMVEHTMGKIFDPYFTTKFLGRGLGLSVVQGIVRGHCGVILADSKQNQGTEIKVFFPADQ